MIELDASHRAELARAVGTIVFLASWVMVFVALGFAHLLLRSQSAGLGDGPIALVGLNTAVLILSSVALRVSSSSGRLMALTGGAAFMILQVVLWRRLWDLGWLPTESPMASSIFALTGFHALHVAVGWCGLAVATLRRRPSRFWSMYWDFVTAVWVAIALVVFA